jgi:hypothetical protein
MARAALVIFGDSSNLVIGIVRVEPDEVGTELFRRAETSAAGVAEEVGIRTDFAFL